MAKLSDLLATREVTAFQENLPKGKIFTVIGVGSLASCIRPETQWCWNSPGCGIAVVEMWGAGGHAACQCCCSVSMPGNTGAYTKKTIAVWPCSVVFGRPGVPCNGPGTSFSNPCVSEGSCLVWERARDLCGNTSGCMCADGGLGGRSCCWGTSYNSPFCCYASLGYCFTLICNGCGIICNVRSGDWWACGWGGDVNKCGVYGRVEFRGCQPMCTCLFNQLVPHPPGQYSEDGGWVVFPTENDHGGNQWAGAGMASVGYMINAHSKNPTGGYPWTACWNGSRFCTCYETHSCMNYMPYGWGATMATPCPDVRDSGRRGGAGAIRITYRGNMVNEEMCIRYGE